MLEYSIMSSFRNTNMLFKYDIILIFLLQSSLRFSCVMCVCIHQMAALYFQPYRDLLISIFTAWCTLVQSAVLRSHVVCPSVCLCLSLNCDHIGWNSSKLISPLVSVWCSLFATPTWRVCSKGNTPKFWPKVTHPLLIWVLESFDCKLRPNGYT